MGQGQLILKQFTKIKSKALTLTTQAIIIIWEEGPTLLYGLNILIIILMLTKIIQLRNRTVI